MTSKQNTTQQPTESELLCPRCKHHFTNPKILPCMHNLCKACLQQHIDEEMGGDRHSSFTCPVCEAKIFVPDPSKATGVWANQFPSNFVIKGMIDAMKAGSPELATPPVVSPGHHPLSKGGSVDVSTSDRPEVQEVWRKLTDLRSSVQSEETGVMSSLTNLSRQRDNQERAVSDVMSKLQAIIDMRKMELLENLSSCFNDEVEKLRQRVQSYRDHQQSLKSCEDMLRSVSRLPESSELASALLESINLQLEEVQYRPRPENPARVVLDYDAQSVYKVTEALASFGSVHVEHESSAGKPALQQASDNGDGPPGQGANARVPGAMPPQLMERIVPGRINQDKQGAQIYDIDVTSGGTLIMSVYGQKLVQAFRPPRLQDGGKVRDLLGRVQLDTEPRCLCMLTQNHVAVAGDACIYLIAVQTHGLELKKTIPTGKSYTGIATYGQDTLVASCQNPVSVDFVSLSGFITETIDKDRTTGHMLFKAPTFLACSPRDGLLFVTDRHKLFCVNNAGKVKYEFPKVEGEELSDAQGVCCDPAGFVFLADRGKKTVLALSARGTRIADVLTQEHGLSDPCAVALDQQGFLYVTNDFTEVLVFRV